MALLKLHAPTKDYLWGGNRLVSEYGKQSAGEVTAESWELSCYPGSESVIVNGEFAVTIIEGMCDSLIEKISDLRGYKMM